MVNPGAASTLIGLVQLRKIESSITRQEGAPDSSGGFESRPIRCVGRARGGGRRLITPSVTRRLIEQFARRPAALQRRPTALSELTKRGFMSPRNTIKTHVARLLVQPTAQPPSRPSSSPTRRGSSRLSSPRADRRHALTVADASGGTHRPTRQRHRRRRHDRQARTARTARGQARKGRRARSLPRAGRELAAAEDGTVTWYAFKITATTYGIFDTFETEEARQAHLNGAIPEALGKVAGDLLALDPDIRPLDMLAVK